MPSLLEALELKYGSTIAECSLTDEELESSSPKTSVLVSIFVPKKSPRHTVPALLVLQDCDIDSAGNDDEKLRNKCKNVEELDLAQNKFSEWKEIFSILQHMPKIKFVNLSFNYLSKDLEVKDGNYEFLKNLVLNGTRVSWSAVQRLIKHLKNIEELHLSLNEYRNVDLDHQDPETKNFSLKKLHFTGNPIESWSEISKLGDVFPNLESLVLAECPIRSLNLKDCSCNLIDEDIQKLPLLSFSEDQANMNPSLYQSEKCHCSQQYSLENTSYLENETYNKRECETQFSSMVDKEPHSSFQMLKFLNINGTLLSTWNDVEELAKFPALKSLRMQNCPLFESPQEYTEHERRQLLMARLPSVETLNGGGVISLQEREDAERAFIRYYMDKPEADRPERYAELVNIHGKLDPLVQVDLTPEKRVKVTFIYGDLVEVRSVDVYRTVFELKTKLESMVKISANKMRLFYVDQVLKTQHGPEEMLFPNKQLYRYNIRNGDEIIIDSKLNRFTSSSSSTCSMRS